MTEAEPRPPIDDMIARSHRFADGVTEAIVRSSVDGIVAFDREFRYTMWNPAMERICGTPCDVVLGNVAFEVFPFLVDMGFDAVFRDVLGGASRAVPRKEYVQASGARLYVDGYYSPLRDAGGSIIGGLGVVRDVTEEVAAHEALRATQEQLVVSQKREAIGQLAATVAHDFNNLLAVVLGCAEMIQRRSDSDADIRFAGEIVDAAQRGAALTTRLLSFSRREVVQLQPVALDEVVRGMAPMLERLLGELVSLRVDAAFAGIVHADRSQLEQVVLNLALNARDAMPSGGTIRVETRAVAVAGPGETEADGTVPPGRHALLSVRDEGTGIQPEVRCRLFEPFFTTKEAGKGTGLGLTIVQSVVTQARGRIEVQSEPGRGTTFSVFLPVVDSNPVKQRDARSLAMPRGDELVLVTEDDPALRRLMVGILADCGYRVLSADGGAEAMRIAEREPGLALLVTDVVMPSMSGRELATSLRRRSPGLRVLFTSGYDAASRDAHDGAPLLRKPFRASELSERVRAALDAPT